MSEASPLFIVDNSDENWKGLRYLSDWTEIADAFECGRHRRGYQKPADRMPRLRHKRKLHAKAYITHPKVKVVGPVTLVGSSNFTLPGLALKCWMEVG